MMKLRDVIAQVEADSSYSEWRKSNKKGYIAHAFMMMDKENENIWQMGYYSPEKDKITTFIVEGEDVKKTPEMDVFKEPGSNVAKLDVSKVKIGSIEAIEKAEEVMAKEYPTAMPMKMFFIIQNINDMGHIYNVTFITQDFSTVNIRISSENCKVLSHKIGKIFEFQK